MTNDTTQKTLTIGLITRPTVFITLGDSMPSLDFDSCISCGVNASMLNALVCSSYCDSEARYNKLYRSPLRKTEQFDSDEFMSTNWIVIELNRIRSDMNALKQTDFLLSEEKRDRLEKLVQDRLKLLKLVEAV